MSKKHFFFFVLVFIFIIFPKDTFAMSKIELSSNNGSVLWSTSNMGENYPYVQNVKYILLYFDIDIMPNSKYNLSAQWSFTTLGSTRNRPTLSYLLLNGNNTQFTHSLGINEETNFQSYYYHWYTDSISFTNNNFSGTTQVQLTYTLPNTVSINQITWHDKGLTFVGSTSTDTNTTINSAASNIINNQNKNTNSIINNNNSNTNRIIESQENINNTLNSDDTSDSEDKASSFFNDFESNNHGLSGILTAPLRLIQSLSSSSCSPLTFPLPFVNQNVSLPCMSTIYNQHFSTFLNIYRIITTGLIGYWIIVKLFGHIRNIQNPEEDKIEVFNL